MICTKTRSLWILVLIILAIFHIVGISYAEETEEIIGIVDTEENLFLPLNRGSSETAMGDLVSDAVHYTVKADVAIVGSGYLKSGIHQGTVDKEDILNIFEQNEEIEIAFMTLPQLKQFLEQCLSNVKIGKDELIDIEASNSFVFPQISGIELKYDPTALPGERIYNLSIAGVEVNMEDSSISLRVASPSGMLDGRKGLPEFEREQSGITLSQALIGYIRDGKAKIYDGNRIYARGLASNTVFGTKSIRWLILVIGVIAIIVIMIIRRSVIFNHFSDEYGKPKKY